MYEYKFIDINLKGVLKLETEIDYHEVIREQALQGWRLVQIFAPSTGKVGSATNFELIFEKKLGEY